MSGSGWPAGAWLIASRSPLLAVGTSHTSEENVLFSKAICNRRADPEGISRGFVVAAGIALLALLIAIVTIRVSRQELAAAVPEPREAAPQPPAPQPGTVQQHEDQAALAAAARPCRLC